MGRVLSILSLSALLLSSACAVSKGGECRVSATEAINTYTVLGQWKKVTGYTPERSESELNLNYDFLIIEPGNYTCMTRVQMGGSVASVFRGNYIADLKNTAIRFPSPMNTVKYGFNDSCNDTKMTLTLSNGDVELYQLLTKDVSVGDCPR